MHPLLKKNPGSAPENEGAFKIGDDDVDGNENGKKVVLISEKQL